jgi:hypothetical protein
MSNLNSEILSLESEFEHCKIYRSFPWIYPAITYSAIAGINMATDPIKNVSN